MSDPDKWQDSGTDGTTVDAVPEAMSPSVLGENPSGEVAFDMEDFHKRIEKNLNQ